MMRRSTEIVAVAALLAIALTVPMVGMVAADNHADHSVTTDTTALTSGTEEMVEITVTNSENSDLVSPIIEIPLRNGLSVAGDRRSTSGGTEFVDGVTVETDSGTESRTAFIDSSSFRGTDAVYVEGVEVPGNGERTYTVPLEVSGSSEITLETDVRPLNNEDQNIRVSETIDPAAEGTIDASYTDATAGGDITISGSQIDSRSASGSISSDVPGGQSYTVYTTLPALNENISISGLQVAELGTETVQFTNPPTDSANTPIVVGQTGSQARVVDGSSVRTTTMGTAETNTTQTVTFDLLVGSGQTVVTVGTSNDLPMVAVDSTTGVDSDSYDSDSGVAILENDDAIDATTTVDFEGRLVGDVTADGTVDGADASSVADGVASNETDSLTDYADVDDNGEISAVEAMYIQQYAEMNRTADYSAVTGGGS
jgi:hypothetical protein